MAQPGNHIGILIKPHGYKGEIQLKGKSHLLENIEIGDPLFIDINGQRIPFFVEEAFSSQPDRLVIKLEFIDSVEEAKKFVNHHVYTGSETEEAADDKTDISAMMDYRVTDLLTGKEGVVTDYMQSAENPILILHLDSKEIMLPLNADYIADIDDKNRIIRVSFPKGLLDL